jgi:enoyl-CoA hydratase/carnithine racemase
MSVLYERRGPVAWIVIDRPEARNALNEAVRDGLWEGFTRFRDDEDALVGVLAGNGPVFCAGADLKEMATRKIQVPITDWMPFLGRNFELEKPVISCVQGVAYAGGFFLAQMCDLCVAADDARFAITEARWSRGSPWAAQLPWLIPPRVALELMITAQPIDAARAYDVGLVNQIVPPATLRDMTQSLAETIARNAPLTVRAAKRMVYATASMAAREALEEADRIFEPVYMSEDAQEGPRAFAEKRAPVWKGR